MSRVFFLSSLSRARLEGEGGRRVALIVMLEIIGRGLTAAGKEGLFIRNGVSKVYIPACCVECNAIFYSRGLLHACLRFCCDGWRSAPFCNFENLI